MNRYRLNRRAFVSAAAVMSLTLPATIGVAQTPDSRPISDTFNWTLVDAESVGTDTSVLEDVRTAVQKRVDENALAGAVVSIGRHGKLIFDETFGYIAPLQQVPMPADALFTMMSSSKVVTAVAILTLQEQGLLSIDDLVSDYVPVFAEAQVAVPPAEFNKVSLLNSEKRKELAEQSVFEPLNTPITIKHLLTHTAGWGTGGVGDVLTPEVPKLASTLAERISQITPPILSFQPGTKWAYSPVAGFDVLLGIVQIASGQLAHEYVQQCILDPTGMAETTYTWPTSESARLVPPLTYSGGKWQTGFDLLGLARTMQAGEMAATPVGEEVFFNWGYPSGSGGLVSTSHDFLLFHQMLLNGGTINGHRIMQPETVVAMSTNHVGSLFEEAYEGMAQGQGFGLGVRVFVESGGPGTPAAGIFGWDGAYGTDTWTDPQNGYAVTVMVQQTVPDLVYEIRGLLNR